jgi:serine phosphatase RsbU (regulator of sigma subunit)
MVDTSLTHQPVAIRLTQFGASEIWLDGIKMISYGQLAADSVQYYDPEYLPTAIQFNRAGHHVLAVKYANYKAVEKGYFENLPFAGFKMRMQESNKAIAEDHSHALGGGGIFILFTGILLTLTLLHIFLYLFNRSVRLNLYYSAFCFSLAFLFIKGYLNQFSSSSSLQANTNTPAYIAVSLMCLSLSGFSNELFSTKKLRFKIIAFLSVVNIIFLFVSKNIAFAIYFVLITTVTFESIILTVRGIYRKVKGAKIIGTGILFFTVFFLSIVLIALFNHGLSFQENSVEGIIFLWTCGLAILSIPLSMSVYLAWNYSYLNRDLKKQLKQVELLSEKNLQQEQEKKILLEQQNQELERKVEERTEEVTRQKNIIEQKNQSITENVRYAQRIQWATLPDRQKIARSLGEIALLYLPKDIVSGDFYFFAEKGDNRIIVAGDCTGHGVSGALMSMIGGSLLHHIINEKSITRPELILNELNEAVIDTLQQSENETHDGMDVAICNFSTTTNLLQYAGANRPLWLLRNGTETMIKPDKSPIGGLQLDKERKFTAHQMALLPGDTVYIFTDGYADQFGGPNGKKMMSSRFRAFLAGICHLPMGEQELLLKDEFEKWKGANDQVDDVLVIGVRI